MSAIDKDCPCCGGEGWVCENHLDVAWGDGAGCECGGAGTNCVCNPEGHSDMDVVFASVDPTQKITTRH